MEQPYLKISAGIAQPIKKVISEIVLPSHDFWKFTNRETKLTDKVEK